MRRFKQLPLARDAGNGTLARAADWARHRWSGAAHRALADALPTRNHLINKGMIWSPNHGDAAFTAPLFDEFMHRIMPGKEWRTV